VSRVPVQSAAGADPVARTRYVRVEVERRPSPARRVTLPPGQGTLAFEETAAPGGEQRLLAGA
jgi:hypothetical protein